jgi:hypothetical protein
VALYNATTGKPGTGVHRLSLSFTGAVCLSHLSLKRNLSVSASRLELGRCNPGSFSSVLEPTERLVRGIMRKDKVLLPLAIN